MPSRLTPQQQAILARMREVDAAASDPAARAEDRRHLARAYGGGLVRRWLLRLAALVVLATAVAERMHPTPSGLPAVFSPLGALFLIGLLLWLSTRER